MFNTSWLAGLLIAALDAAAAAVEAVRLSLPEMVRLTTWVDSNGQFYGSYYGRRNLRYRDHPNFRPEPTFAEAIAAAPPLPEDKR